MNLDDATPTTGTTRTRREFLKLLRAIPLIGSLGALHCSAADSNRASAVKLTGLFEQLQSAAAVGAKYVEAFPHERDLNLLLRELLIRRVDFDPSTASQSEVNRVMREQHRMDMRERRTVRLQGWLLSLTEARLCALAHLAQLAQ